MDIVYSVKYSDCDTTYIGETMCTLDARMKEHKRHTIKGNTLKSVVAEHESLLDHTIDWQSANVLHYTRNFRQHITEALHIRKHAGALMNKDQGWVISKAWNASR